MAGARRSGWWAGLRALAILATLALLLDSLALAGPPWVLIPPILPLLGLGYLIGHAGGVR